MQNNNATLIKNSEEEIFIKKYYLVLKNNIINSNIKKSQDEISTLKILKPNNFVRKFYTNYRNEI